MIIIIIIIIIIIKNNKTKEWTGTDMKKKEKYRKFTEPVTVNLQLK